MLHSVLHIDCIYDFFKFSHTDSSVLILIQVVLYFIGKMVILWRKQSVW